MGFKEKIKSLLPTRETHHHYHSNDTGYVADIMDAVFDGNPFPGGFGTTKSYTYVDYYTLRERSMQLFTENIYCKGVIRRLITNEIHTGLTPEVMPLPTLTGMDDDQAQEWGDDREIDWKLWGDNPQICDYDGRRTIGEIQADARRTALISGDCLEVLHINKKTKLPMVQLIDGRHIQTFINAKPRQGNVIKHGIEFKGKRQVAYWVRDENDPLKAKRIPAYGEKSGRRLAWMVYGSEMRLDDVRGEPILSAMLYMLKELDRYRTAEQRAAVVNAMLPMFIKAGDGVGTNVIDQGAQLKGSVDRTSITGTGIVETKGRKWDFAKWLPGTVPQGLAKGEEPVNFNTTRPNVNFGKFEETIINVFAWTLEIPPETLRLMYQSNFSASRQANNELDLYLQKRNAINGATICQPVYIELTIQSVLTGSVSAPGLLEAWKNPKQWKTFGAWMNVVWVGISRPSVDIKKEVDAAEKALNAGIGDYDHWNRRITGQSFGNVVKLQKRQRELAKKNGLIFAAEENQNREPAAQPGEQQQQIDDMQMRFDELEEIVETMEGARG